MKFITMIEDKINDLLIKLGILLSRLIHKVIPQKFFDKITAFKQKIADIKAALKEKIVAFIQKCKTKALDLKDKILAKVNFLKAYPFKEKILLQKVKVIEKVKALKGTPLFQIIKPVTDKCKVVTDKIKVFTDKLSPKQILSSFIILAVAGFGALNVYVSGKNIWEEQYGSRKPASIKEIPLERRDYYKKDKRTHSLQTVVLPLIKKNKHSIKTITIDIGIVASNRFTSRFLKIKETEIRDHFLMTFEPIESSFPIRSEEGKTILRDKMMRELNHYLKENKIEGRVEDVKLVYILGV